MARTPRPTRSRTSTRTPSVTTAGASPERRPARWGAHSPERDQAIIAAVAYCERSLGAFRQRVDDYEGLIALAVVEAYPSYRPGPASWLTWAHKACRWALTAELGVDVVTPARSLRRQGVRATFEPLPEERRKTDIDAA